MTGTPEEPDAVPPPLEMPDSFRDLDKGHFEATIEASGDETVVSVAGELDVLTAPLLWEHLEEAIAAGRPVVLDLAGVSFVDSMGIGAMVRAQKRLAETGRSLTVRSPQPPVRKVFEVTGLESALGLVGGPGLSSEAG
ncbi:MAG: STAS domain-containing protein [Acidimicrobiia bacterium]